MPAPCQSLVQTKPGDPDELFGSAGLRDVLRLIAGQGKDLPAPAVADDVLDRFALSIGDIYKL